MTSDLTAALERLKREAGELCPGDPLDEAIMAVLRAAPPAETGARELAGKAYAVGWSAGIAFTKLRADDPRGPQAFFDEHISKAEALATPVDPPTGPMDRLRESWRNSLPVDPSTGECETCGGYVWIDHDADDAEVEDAATVAWLETLDPDPGPSGTYGGGSYSRQPCPDCSGDGEGEVGTLIVEADSHLVARHYVSDAHRPDEPQFDATAWGRVTTDLPPGTYRIFRDPTGDAPGGETGGRTCGTCGSQRAHVGPDYWTCRNPGCSTHLQTESSDAPGGET